MLLKCTIFAVIWPQFDDVTLAFQSRLKYRNFDFSRVIGNHFCTSYRNLVRFGSVTAEISLLKRRLFLRYSKNRHISPNSSEVSWTYLDLHYRFGRRIDGDYDYPNIHLVLAQRSCHGNQLNLGNICNDTRNDLYSLLWHSTMDWPIMKQLFKD